MSSSPFSFDQLVAAVAAPKPIRMPAPARPASSPEAAPAPAADVAPSPSKTGKKRAAGEKKKRGPKPRDAADLRGHCVSVRMNAAELEALDKRRGELARGEWMRLAEAGALPPAPPPSINIEAWTKLATALGNLNQIARALNTDRASVEIDEALAAVREFRNALIGAEMPRSAKKAKAA